jgi:hypothetical protein
MSSNGPLLALQEQLRGQIDLADGCEKRALAAADWRVTSAWTGAFLQLHGAIIETALVLNRLEKGACPSPRDPAAGESAPAEDSCSAR